MTPSIHVISPISGIGNRLDLEIVSPILEQSGMAVTSYPVADRGKRARFGRIATILRRRRRRFDVNIFMGALFPEWLPMARQNVWIPNPEGFAPHLRKWLPRLDFILAKTRLTEHIFRDLGHDTKFIGFTSRDHYEPAVPRDFTRFFHACSSPYKGTKRLLEVWKAHPEWPELVIVVTNRDEVVVDFRAPNVRIISEYLPDAEYRQLQNSMGFHICCSEAEGFGHYLMEALSCGAVILATDAPPMNELVQPDRGMLLDCVGEGSEVGLTHRSFFKPESLEEQVRRVLNFDRPTLDQIGASARAFFLENDRLFRRSLPEVVRNIADRSALK
jgi:glycosyltransferase involved in cell wall biosynthesis